jgi:hypothetical protein
MNQEEALRLLLSDRILFIETLMEIENKDRQLVPFILNPIQRRILTESCGRDVYVKPAQIGASSIMICDFLIDVLTIPGTTSVYISYDEFITGRLLRKAQIFYDTLKRKVPSIPDMHHKSTSEKTFPEVNGSFYIGTARGCTVGRGETIHNLGLDEYAFFQPGDAEKLFASALQRVPTVSGSKVRITSTPNGEDNDFHETYKAAKEGRATGKSVFKAHFYSWYEHPEYQMAFNSPFTLPGDNVEVLECITPDEEKLIKYCNLNMSQIRWRRYKIAELASLRRSGETRLLFGQEYPEDDVSCFLTAGDMVYDTIRVDELMKSCYPAPYSYMGADIWYPPELGHKYLTPIDPGLGKSSESVAEVWDFNATDQTTGKLTYRHCATLGGYYPSEQMGQKSIELAKYYYNSILAPEASLDILPYVKDYPYIYYKEDPVSGKVGNCMGWLTSPKTKPYMINEVSRNLDKIECHDRRIISQMRNIRWIGDRPIGIGADDYHDAMAIAIACRTQYPIEKGCVGVSGWKW